MEGCLTLVKHVKPHVSPSEAKVADYILGNAQRIPEMNITELARESGASTGAVIRLCKSLGIKGYSELKIMLAKDVFGSSEHVHGPLLFDLQKAGTTENLTSLMVDTVIESISALKAVLNSQQVAQAVRIIDSASSVLCCGIGASGLAAMDLYEKLIRLGIISFCPNESDLQLVHASALNSTSACLVFSYSGEKSEMCQVAEQAKKAGATVIAISRIGGNSLSKIADINLSVPDNEAIFRQGATLSRLNQMVVVDIIYSSLICRRDTSSEYIKNTYQAVNGWRKRK
ncbi:MAG: MurR/RpiR family transcriptional regulator [Sphaerochaetaceae bacterium]